MRGRSRRWILGAGVGTGLALSGAANAQPKTMTFGQAMKALAEHRSAAEQAVALLKLYKVNDLALRSAYAKAKAAFDGLIAQLRAELTVDGPRALPANFEATLRSASNLSIAFVAKAEMKLRTKEKDGAKTAVLRALLGEPDKLVKALFDGGLGVWKAISEAKTDERGWMIAQVEQERWRNYADIPPAV